MADIVNTSNAANETSDQYRFSGYNLPMLQLDETGAAYYYIPQPHPYYTSQPYYYQKDPGWGAPAPNVIATTVSKAEPIPEVKTSKSGLYRLS